MSDNSQDTATDNQQDRQRTSQPSTGGNQGSPATTNTNTQEGQTNQQNKKPILDQTKDERLLSETTVEKKTTARYDREGANNTTT